jgi:hypothetical protein
VRLVAAEETFRHVADRGGNLYLWPRETRCCAGRTFTLEAATQPPDRTFVPLCEQDGIAVWAPPGLAGADEVQLELGRRGHLRAFWNGQSWIG